MARRRETTTGCRSARLPDGVGVAIPTGRSDGPMRWQVTVRARWAGVVARPMGGPETPLDRRQLRMMPLMESLAVVLCYCVQPGPQRRHRRRRLKPDHARRTPCGGPAARPDPPRARRNLTPPSNAPPASITVSPVGGRKIPLPGSTCDTRLTGPRSTLRRNFGNVVSPCHGRSGSSARSGKPFTSLEHTELVGDHRSAVLPIASPSTL